MGTTYPRAKDERRFDLNSARPGGARCLFGKTGRKTGKRYTTPVNYYREGDTLWVMTSRDRTWWRNLQGGARVDLRLRGRDVSGQAEAVLDAGEVANRIGDYVQHLPMAAKPLGVRLENGQPNPEDAARLAGERLFVKISLGQGA